MKLPFLMLLDFVETELPPEAVGDLLTMAGFELEEIISSGAEAVLDVKVMSNRGDALSVLGLAREVVAKSPDAAPTDLYRRASARFADRDPGGPESPAAVAIEIPDCARYACRIWNSVPQGEAPDWIRRRLELAGMRSIGLLVDLTNYVMLELGQPLHAFDYDKLAEGRIVVRLARPGERIVALNGQELKLDPEDMVIADALRPVAVAGVMGGLDSEVTSGTRRILLESAHFAARRIRRTRKRLGLSTEASYRYERSVDPEGAVAAILRFTELLGVAGSEIVDEYPGRAERPPVSLRLDRASRLLGMRIPDDEAKSYLERLGMEVAGHGDPYFVAPPSWRPDVELEEDLVEELGRVHGYERIPEELPRGATSPGGPQGYLLWLDGLREEVVRAGFVQVIGHSLRAPSHLDAPWPAPAGPRAPASPETSRLRNSLLPSLADAAARNGGRNLHLFEIGDVFGRDGDAWVESRRLALLAQGGELYPSWGDAPPPADFFSLKGALDGVLSASGVAPEYEAPESADPRLHPTRQAVLRAKGRDLGVLGQIHPDVAAVVGLPPDTFLAEIEPEVAFAAAASEAHVREISRRPAVRRDIALLVDRDTPWPAIEAAVVDAAGEELERHWLFDVYQGENLPPGKHSLGIALLLRSPTRTFTDEEANRVRERVVAALSALGGSTR